MFYCWLECMGFFSGLVDCYYWYQGVVMLMGDCVFLLDYEYSVGIELI